MVGEGRAGQIVVVGLGPGDPGMITVGAAAYLSSGAPVYLRTSRHPSAEAVVAGGASSFDVLYESARSIEEVYEGIVEALLDAARSEGQVVYAVPGSPLVAERAVEMLRCSGADVLIVPAMSFLDVAWARLGVDPIAAGVALVDGHRFAEEAAGRTGPMLVAQCDSTFVLSDIKLAVEVDPGAALVLQRLGLPDESVLEVAWEDLDRSVDPDHLTCVWIPRLAVPVSQAIPAGREKARRAGRSRGGASSHSSHSATFFNTINSRLRSSRQIRPVRGEHRGT